MGSTTSAAQSRPKLDNHHNDIAKLNTLLKFLGWHGKTLAHWLGVTPKAVSAWRTGKRPVPGYTPEIDGTRYVVPYTNAYVVNGAVIAPQVDPALDDKGYRILEQAFPGREIAPAPSTARAVGGGGLARITQQAPVGEPAAP